MSVRPIPENAVEIQPGLWAAEVHLNYAGVDRMWYDLHSAEGHHFWNVHQPENYDEEGNLLPLEQRVFAQYAATAFSTVEDLNANFVSVSVQ
jgi:hypothetical protein